MKANPPPKKKMVFGMFDALEFLRFYRKGLYHQEVYKKKKLN